ncbi:LPXTG cell wall anchor domain-containing protein [Micromonospora eburnea]|uniref:LPXTG cell wall anchor domain-containing protein n=1 Tax=Micromonospora eburnea TaxID=227316 RepID=UPI000B88A01D
MARPVDQPSIRSGAPTGQPGQRSGLCGSRSPAKTEPTSLPITGTATGLIAGIGALLLAAGVGGYVIARRRKTRFVA